MTAATGIARRAAGRSRSAGLALLFAATLPAAACAISPDASPRDIPADQFDEFGLQASGDEAAGQNRIYLLTPPDAQQRQRLRAVARNVGDDPNELLTSLFAGPNAGERDSQLSTALPTEIQLLGARTVGRVLTVDVNDSFGELTAEALGLALAQLVATATEIDGIERVRLQTNGESRSWPVGNGELSDQPLSIYDYPGVLETSQPAFPALPSN